MEKSITIAAIVCITALEAIALFQGVNGTAFMLVVASLAGLGGYGVGKYTRKVDEKWVS